MQEAPQVTRLKAYLLARGVQVREVKIQPRLVVVSVRKAYAATTHMLMNAMFKRLGVNYELSVDDWVSYADVKVRFPEPRVVWTN